MKNIPRLLPLAAIAVVGVLAVKLASGVTDLPSLFSGAKAFAEETLGKKGKASGATDASLMPDASNAPPPAKPAAVCAPTAAELAKEAGLSPAELQQLQNLGARRDQLDQRESGMDTELQLLAAAEAKVDAKLQQLTGLKGDITTLLHQVNDQQDVEVNRMVAVYSAMKPKDAAARMVLLDDDVRLPVAAKMKERTLANILAQMPPPDAKKLTESLAQRFSGASAKANAALATPNAPPAAQPAPTPPAQAAATPAPTAATPAPAKTADATPAKRRAPRAKPRALAKARPAKTGSQLAAKSGSAPDSPAAAAAAAGDTAKATPPGAPAK